MDEACDLSELELLDYLLGAGPELRARVERSAACRAAAAGLAGRMALLYRAQCPAPDVLVAYQERRLTQSALQLAVHRHAAGCPHCAEELALLAQIDAVPLEPQPSPLRRLVAAVFQPPLARAAALRGDLLLYQAPGLTLHLRVRQALGQPGVWTVRGQARDAHGELVLSLAGAGAEDAAGASYDAALDGQGGFRFERLPAGRYRLTIETPDEAVLISDLLVGDLQEPHDV